MYCYLMEVKIYYEYTAKYRYIQYIIKLALSLMLCDSRDSLKIDNRC